MIRWRVDGLIGDPGPSRRVKSGRVRSRGARSPACGAGAHPGLYRSDPGALMRPPATEAAIPRRLVVGAYVWLFLLPGLFLAAAPGLIGGGA
jgi:hypothetical protein